MLEYKRMRARRMRWCFAKVSESRHSPLALIGAPAQGPCSPLVHARTKCSLRADSSTLHHGESPKTTHKLDTSHPQALPEVFVSPITTEPSRWWRSPRVTSKELLLDPNRALESGGCTHELLELTREGFTQEISQFSMLSKLLLLSCTTRCFSADQIGKRPPMDEVEEYKYSPSSLRAGHPNSSENGCTGRAQYCTGRAP